MTDSEVNKKRSLNFAFLPIEGIQVIACRKWLKTLDRPSRFFRTAAGDNALRQAEAKPAHLSMVIGERLQGKGAQRMGIGGRSAADCEGLAGDGPNTPIGILAFLGAEQNVSWLSVNERVNGDEGVPVWLWVWLAMAAAEAVLRWRAEACSQH